MRVNDYVESFGLMAQSWAETSTRPQRSWETDVARFLRDHDGIVGVSWGDADGKLAWIFPAAPFSDHLGLDYTDEPQRLATLVAAPAERRLFRNERIEPEADCVAAFLIDCSGSMRQHIESIAMLADVLLRAFEQAGVATELLGFTTGGWNGGRVMREWNRAGRPPHPGRLNEVLHLVFKDADTTWRRARRDIAALLKADLFREGIDGEALDWACNRLEARDAKRRLLFVVSDGCPMDTATALANDEHYLDHHLREVVARRERDGRVTIHGIGVGLDLSPYYGRCQALDLRAPPGNRVFCEVLELIADRRRR